MSKGQQVVQAKYQQIVDAWRAKKISTRQDLEQALDEYAVRFAFNSGRIENNQITYHDTREIFEHGRAAAFTGNVCTLFEVQNLKLSYEQMLDAFETKLPINETLVLSFHQTLTQGTYDQVRWANGERPGEYKKRDYVVGAGDVGTPANRVSKEVRSLCKELAAATPENILTAAAYFHLMFESIHPFVDGNGRCGRALLNYLLLLNDHPPLIVFEKDKMAYYGMFAAWDNASDLAPALDFLKVELVKTWQGV